MATTVGKSAHAASVCSVIICEKIRVISGHCWSSWWCIHVILREISYQCSADQISDGAGGAESRQKSRVCFVYGSVAFSVISVVSPPLFV